MYASVHVIAAEERKKRRIRRLAENMIKGQLGDGLFKLATKQADPLDPNTVNKILQSPLFKPSSEPDQVAAEEESSALKLAPEQKPQLDPSPDHLSKSEVNTRKTASQNKVQPKSPSKSATFLKWNPAAKSRVLLPVPEKTDSVSTKK